MDGNSLPSIPPMPQKLPVAINMTLGSPHNSSAGVPPAVERASPPAPWPARYCRHNINKIANKNLRLEWSIAPMGYECLEKQGPPLHEAAPLLQFSLPSKSRLWSALCWLNP